MLLRPRQEWQAIAQEPTTAAELYRSYVAPLAAIGPVSLAIGSLIFVPGISFASLVAQAIIGFVLSLAIVYVIAMIVDRLAPTFGGTRSVPQALKVAGYGVTAAFVTGISSIAPFLGVLGILGLYSVYEIYTGIPVLMKAPQDRALAYTAVVIVLLVAVTAVLSIGYFALFPPAI